jgi:AcrR family transcriptional regulator
MPGATRDRIRATAAELLSRQGYPATGLKQISIEARSPFGSIYHFYPSGKEELAEDAIRSFGPEYGKLFDRYFPDEQDLVAGVRAAFAGAAERLAASNFADACPIATVALEVASTSETLRRATADVFDSWLARGIDRFIAHGLSADKARSVAMTLIMALEGAFLLSRAHRNTEPLLVAAEAMAELLRNAVDAASGVSDTTDV